MKTRSLWLAVVLALGLVISVAANDLDLTALGFPEEVADYHTWSRANVDKSFIESAHPIMKDVYYNDEAAAAFENDEFSFPYAEGSVFVKESTDPETLLVSVITVMRKADEADEETGGWEWGMWMREGMDDDNDMNDNMNDNGMAMRGFEGDWLPAEEAVNMCVECHSAVSDQDYTFLDYLDRHQLGEQ
jgi:hypothetical protein